MKKVKLVIVEDSQPMSEKLEGCFQDNEYCTVVGKAADGYEAVTCIEATQPDVVLLDLVLPKMDGLSVMSMAKQKCKCKFLVVSGLCDDNFVTKALQGGASYFIFKPFDPEILRERVYDLAGIGASTAEQLAHNTYDKVVADYQAATPRLRNRSADERISNIFITVGIPAHIKGYQFLREAIKLTINNPDIINAITKQLYPQLAKHFNTTPSKIERAIRHAIEVAWNRGRIENINSIFGVKVYTSNEKPTNGEFIALIADKMLIEGS